MPSVPAPSVLVSLSFISHSFLSQFAFLSQLAPLFYNSLLFRNSLLSFAPALLRAFYLSCLIVPYPGVSLHLLRPLAPLAPPALLSATCVPLSLAVHHPTAASSYTKWSAAVRRTPRRGQSWGCNFRPKMVPYASLGTPDSRCDWRVRILLCMLRWLKPSS
jgi:hypothetical protein